MNPQLSLLSLLGASVWLLVVTPVAASAFQDGTVPGDVTTMCSKSEPSGSSPATPETRGEAPQAVPTGIQAFLDAAAPVGVEIGALALGSPQWRSGQEDNLGLLRWTVPAGDYIRRTAIGPGLIWVVQGDVWAQLDGEVVGRAPGDHLVVELGSLYGVQGTGPRSASVLYVWLRPTPEDLTGLMATPFAGVGEPAEWEHHPTDQGNVSASLIAFEPSGDLLGEWVELFAACLRWNDAAGVFHATELPGPVGVCVLAGSAVINRDTLLDRGRCWVARAGNDLEVGTNQNLEALMFGALPPSE